MKISWYRVGRAFCRIICRLFLRVKIYGRENVPSTGGVLLVSNHQSYLDPVFCGIRLKRDLYFLVRHTLYEGHFWGRIIKALNTIPVRRGEADLTAMRMVIKKLREGNAVCLFPEGTRTKDGKISSFKPGFSLLCKRSQTAVIPIAIEGAFEAWPRTRKFFWPWKKIVIRYGEIIPAEKIKNIDAKELAKIVTATLRQMQNDCRISADKKPFEY